MQGQRTALVALGANLPSALGAPDETVRVAMGHVQAAFPSMVASRLFRCPAFPAGSGPDFVNAAVRFDTDMDAGGVLEVLHSIEAALGRARGVRWASRVIDLDLLALGDVVQPDLATQSAWRALPLARQMAETPDQLILPHPRLQERGFVLKPLADVAADWVHPILGLSVQGMLDDLPDADTADVVPF